MVHDSVIMSIDPSDDPKKYALILENCLKLNVESKIDYKTGKNWAEVK